MIPDTLGFPSRHKQAYFEATLLRNPWYSESYTGDGKIVQEEELIV